MSFLQELEEKDTEVKRRQEKNKQLVLKLCNMQKHAETVDYKLKKLESDHEKAIKTIQGFMERQQQLENSKMIKEQKIIELELELSRLREGENSKIGRDRRDERNSSNQVDIMIFQLCSAIYAFLKNPIVIKIYSVLSKLVAIILFTDSHFLANKR